VRPLLGLGAMLLAMATGYLALSSGFGAVVGIAVSPDPAGPIRGVVFAAVMGAATVGLFWVALRSFGPRR
jgi:hypothetical protein